MDSVHFAVDSTDKQQGFVCVGDQTLAVVASYWDHRAGTMEVQIPAGEFVVVSLCTSFKELQGYAKGDGTVGNPFIFRIVAAEIELFKVLFVYQESKGEKEARPKTFAVKPTFEQVMEAVEQVYTQFTREAFELKMEGEVVRSDNWGLLADNRGRVEIAVISIRRPFSSFTLYEGLELLGIRGVTACPELSATVEELILDKALHERTTRNVGWKTIGDLMDHVGRDLAARALVSKPQYMAKEARCRELISPVLMAAVILAGAGDVEMHADFTVNGVRSNGSIEWVLVYKQLNIVVVQASLMSKWEEYVGQLAAGIMGSREEFALNVLGKRKSEAVEAMSTVPSWGILTNGLAYKSTTMPLYLDQDTTAEAARESALPVIAMVKHILEEHKAAADAIPALKRRRFS